MQLEPGSSTESQRNNLDAQIGRRIQKIARGAGMFVVGAVGASNIEAFGEDLQTPVRAVSAGLISIGALRVIIGGMSKPSIEAISEVHHFSSCVRMPGSYISLLFSKKLYKKWRKNYQYGGGTRRERLKQFFSI